MQEGGRHQPDRGVATVVCCLGAAALIAVFVIGVHLAAAVLARQRAENAADLAALAAAAVVLEGPNAACARGLQVAAANDAELVSCDVLDFDVRISVEVSAQIGPLGGPARAAARAGPLTSQG